jgi:hypothetical protein
MRVDHLRELLHHIIERIVISAGEIVLANLLVERGEAQQRHNVRVRVLDGNVERLVAGVVDEMVVGPVLEQEAGLAGVSVQGGQVEGRVALPVRRGRLGAVQDEEFGGHHAAGQDGLDKITCITSFVMSAIQQPVSFLKT